jgi:hypothetical protein
LQDPLQIDSYLRYNIFLPDINNEREDKNANYADNLAALQRLVLFRFEEDTTGAAARATSNFLQKLSQSNCALIVLAAYCLITRITRRRCGFELVKYSSSAKVSTETSHKRWW